MMKTRPILFNTEMVQAILNGRKTQTRRVIKKPEQWQLEDQGDGIVTFQDKNGDFHNVSEVCPFGGVGDRLYVRETFAVWGNHEGSSGVDYKASTQQILKWTPSIHMPKKLSRITLEITDIRVERLQDITGGDCVAEGTWKAEDVELGRSHEAKEAFTNLWDSIYKNWNDNPWVWVAEFKQVEGGNDE